MVDVPGSARYQWIGFDHFARPDDEFAVDVCERRPTRNSMRSTTHAAQRGTAGDVGGPPSAPRAAEGNAFEAVESEWTLHVLPTPV